MLSIVLFSLFLCANAQTSVDIAGVGATGSGAAAFQGAGVGSDVVASGVLDITPASSVSAVQVIATGPVSTPRPFPRPTPKPSPKSTPPKVQPKPYGKIHPVHPPKKVYYEPKPKCEDIKDDKCYKIDDFKYCGFCIEYKYPIKGYACKYDYEYVKKKTGSKKEYSYDKVLTPKCKCKGEFIIKGEYCPKCDDLLYKLLQCAGIKDTKYEVEISEKYLKETGIAVEALIKCGYVEEKKDDKKEVIVKKDKQVEHKPVIVKIDKEEKPDYKPVPMNNNHKPAPKPVTAQASATATAVGGSATASAIASASTSGKKL